jgi:hypothetical protein
MGMQQAKAFKPPYPGPELGQGGMTIDWSLPKITVSIRPWRLIKRPI